MLFKYGRLRCSGGFTFSLFKLRQFKSTPRTKMWRKDDEPDDRECSGSDSGCSQDQCMASMRSSCMNWQQKIKQAHEITFKIGLRIAAEIHRHSTDTVRIQYGFPRRSRWVEHLPRSAASVRRWERSLYVIIFYILFRRVEVLLVTWPWSDLTFLYLPLTSSSGSSQRCYENRNVNMYMCIFSSFTNISF